MTEFRLSPDHEKWASKSHQKASPSVQRKILLDQQGLCALSGVQMRFDIAERTPANGLGCHPLSPAVDHIDPGNPNGGYQIICYALNDLKGHMPVECFEALRKTDAWKKLMQAWREQAEADPADQESLKRLLRPNAKPKKKRPRRPTA